MIKIYERLIKNKKYLHFCLCVQSLTTEPTLTRNQRQDSIETQKTKATGQENVHEMFPNNVLLYSQICANFNQHQRFFIQQPMGTTQRLTTKHQEKIREGIHEQNVQGEGGKKDCRYQRGQGHRENTVYKINYTWLIGAHRE